MMKLKHLTNWSFNKKFKVKMLNETGPLTEAWLRYVSSDVQQWDNFQTDWGYVYQ